MNSNKVKTRLRRLLRITTLVQAGPGWGPQRLADECDVAVRTIHRDMDDLKAAGINWTFDRSTKSYVIDDGVFLAPLQISEDEALALMLLGEEIAGPEQIPLLHPAHHGVAKLLSRIPDETRKNALRKRAAISIHTAPPIDDAAADVYARILDAIESGRRLRCEYDRPAGDRSEAFILEPYKLIYKARAWHVVGRAIDAGHLGETPCLRLGLFAAITPLDEHFEHIDDFSLEEHLGNAWLLRPGEKQYRVELRIDAEWAGSIAETRWHKTQSTELHADGSATLRFVVSGLDEIIWWILSMGSHCRVISPPTLIRRVQREIESMHAAYADGPLCNPTSP